MANIEIAPRENMALLLDLKLSTGAWADANVSMNGYHLPRFFASRGKFAHAAAGARPRRRRRG
jgi:hypothetical protein